MIDDTDAFIDELWPRDEAVDIQSRLLPGMMIRDHDGSERPVSNLEMAAVLRLGSFDAVTENWITRFNDWIASL